MVSPLEEVMLLSLPTEAAEKEPPPQLDESDADVRLSYGDQFLDYSDGNNVAGDCLNYADGNNLEAAAGDCLNLADLEECLNLEVDVEDWKRGLRPGMKFRPTDEELVHDYLHPHVKGLSEFGGPITHADIYDYHPQLLPGLAEDHGDRKLYFYTWIKKIGKSKTDRSVKCSSSNNKGYWKPTQAPKPIRAKSTGITIGYKTSLAYFQDKKKTQWLMQMQEYKIPSHPTVHQHEYVVAVVYYYQRRQRNDADDYY